MNSLKIAFSFTGTILSLLLIGTNLWAQQKLDIKAKEDTKKVCDIFLDKIIKGDLKKAFDSIKQYITVPEKDFKEVVDETGRQRTELSKRFGGSIAFELIHEQFVADTLIKYTYIEKCKLHVIRWSFIFYKPEDKWVLNSFYWDDNVRDLFK